MKKFKQGLILSTPNQLLCKKASLSTVQQFYITACFVLTTAKVYISYELTRPPNARFYQMHQIINILQTSDISCGLCFRNINKKMNVKFSYKKTPLTLFGVELYQLIYVCSLLYALHIISQLLCETLRNVQRSRLLFHYCILACIPIKTYVYHEKQ